MSIKKVSAMLLTFSIIIIASGCQLFKGDSISTTDVFKTNIATKTGFYGEKFLPQDAVLVAGIDMQEASQTGAFNKLRAKFVDDTKWSEWKNEAFTNFDDGVEESGISFANDFLPIWGDNPRFVVAIDKKGYEYLNKKNYPVEMPSNGYPIGEITSEDAPEDISASSEPIGYTGEMTKFDPEIAESTTEFDGGAYFVAKIENVEKYNAMMKALVDKEKLKKIEGQQDDVYEVEGVFVGRYQDMMLISNSLENWLSSVKRARSGEKNITDNETFKTVFSNLLYPHVMYLYVDSQAVAESALENFKSAFGASTEEQKLAGDKFAELYAKRFAFEKASGVVVTLEDEGVRFKTYSFADESRLKAEDEGYEWMTGDLTLMKRIPGEGVIFYEELGEGVMEVVGEFGGIVMPLAGITLEDFKQQFKSVTGLDWDKDVASFAKKNVAFYITDGGALVPGFGFAIDASADVEAAKRTMTVVNSNLSLLLTGAKASMTEDQLKALEQTDVDFKGNKVNKISYDLSKLSAEALSEIGVPAGMTNLAIEFYYGVTGDNVFLVTLHQNLDKLYGKSSLSGSSEYKNALNEIGSEYQQGALAYLNTAPAWALADRFVEAIYADSQDSSSDKQEYEEIKAHFQPLKTVIFGSKASRTESFGAGYISIQ